MSHHSALPMPSRATSRPPLPASRLTVPKNSALPLPSTPRCATPNENLLPSPQKQQTRRLASPINMPASHSQPTLVPASTASATKTVRRQTMIVPGSIKPVVIIAKSPLKSSVTKEAPTASRFKRPFSLSSANITRPVPPNATTTKVTTPPGPPGPMCPMGPPSPPSSSFSSRLARPTSIAPPPRSSKPVTVQAKPATLQPKTGDVFANENGKVSGTGLTIGSTATATKAPPKKILTRPQSLFTKLPTHGKGIFAKAIGEDDVYAETHIRPRASTQPVGHSRKLSPTAPSASMATTTLVVAPAVIAPTTVVPQRAPKRRSLIRPRTPPADLNSCQRCHFSLVAPPSLQELATQWPTLRPNEHLDRSTPRCQQCDLRDARTRAADPHIMWPSSQKQIEVLEAQLRTSEAALERTTRMQEAVLSKLDRMTGCDGAVSPEPSNSAPGRRQHLDKDMGLAELLEAVVPASVQHEVVEATALKLERQSEELRSEIADTNCLLRLASENVKLGMRSAWVPFWAVWGLLPGQEDMFHMGRKP